jgi:hypothetical protein
MTAERSFSLGVVLYTMLIGWSDPCIRKVELDAFHAFVYGKKFSKDDWNQVKHEIRRHLLKTIPILESVRSLCQIQIYADQVRAHPEMLDFLTAEFKDDVVRVIEQGGEAFEWFPIIKQMVGSQIKVKPIKRVKCAEAQN